MIFDLKHYNPSNRQTAKNAAIAILAVIALLLILGWMGERDRQHYLTQLKIASDSRCV